MYLSPVMIKLLDAPQLNSNLNLKFNLSGEKEVDTQIISISRSLLKPNTKLGITLSKINAVPNKKLKASLIKSLQWPVKAYARVYPDRPVTFEEAESAITELLLKDPFFHERQEEDDPNFYNGECDIRVLDAGFQCGLDTEKLSFQVKEQANDNLNLWLVVGLRRIDSKIISRANIDTTESIYKDFWIDLRVERQPASFMPLLILLSITLIVYIGFLKKYHMKLFE